MFPEKNENPFTGNREGFVIETFCGKDVLFSCKIPNEILAFGGFLSMPKEIESSS